MSYDVLAPEAARLWRFGPDWRSGFNVRRSFWTDIVTSRNNTEQRRALRNSPRFGLDYRATVKGSELSEANRWLRAWQNKPTVIPDFARWARLTGASIVGASTLTVSPLPAWAAEGQRLVLCGDVMEEVLVDSVAGTTINLVEPLANAWAIGAVLRPTFFGLLAAKTSSSRLTPGAAEISVDFEAYPGGSPPRAAGAAWATLGTREVFTLDPDYHSSPSVSYVWPVEQVDAKRGRTAQFRPIDRAERTLEADISGLDVTTATQLEQFFDRMRGRRGAFYVPTGEKDFSLAATAGSGTATFLHSGLDIADDFGSINYANIETAIAVFLTNGTRIYRRITDIAASGGNSLITVSATWGTALTTANVARISWMPIYRFASDDFTTSWQTPLSARARVSFQSVRR